MKRKEESGNTVPVQKESSEIKGTCGLPAGPILMSACLLGEPCRYDAKSIRCANAMAFASEHDIIPVCPEQLGGLSTPRTPCEIQPGGRVLDANGLDKTSAYEKGAREAVNIARMHGAAWAILKAKSPSCGANQIYDGTFSGTLVKGQGLTAAALREAGITVIDENDLANLPIRQS